MLKLLEKWILRLHNYKSSLKTNQGNAIDRISNTIAFCAQFTYYFFCSPHTWNGGTRLVEFGDSKWNWRSKVWKISILICLIVTLTKILMEFRYILLVQEDPTTIILFRRVNILSSILCLVCQLNTVWKVKEYKELINQTLQLLRRVEQDRVLPTATLNRIFRVTRILTIFLFALILYSPFAFAIFVAYPEIDPNIYSKLLPGVFNTKSVAGRREYWNPFFAFGVGVLEFIVFSQQCFHVLNYASFTTIGAMSVLRLLQEMKNVIARDQDNMDSPLLDMNYFIKLYKAVYLLSNRLNDWIASTVIPGTLSIGIATVVCLNYTLLTKTTNDFEKFTMVFIVFGLVLFFGVTLHMGSFLSFSSKEALRAMTIRRVVLESKYDSRRLQGCKDCRTYFGSFFYFSQTNSLELGHILVDYTIQAILTFP